MKTISLYIQKYYLFFIVGAIASLSQAPFNIIFLSILGFAGLFYLFKKNSHLNGFCIGHSFGFGYYLVGLYWVGNALLTDTSQFGIFLPFAYLGLPLALAIFYGLAVSLAKNFIIVTKLNSVYQIIFFAFSFALTDFIRGYIFTGFPWNLPVYATISIIELAQPVYYMGAYLYNFVWLVFCFSFAFYLLPQKKKSNLFLYQLGFLAFFGMLGAYHIQHSQGKLSLDKEIIRIVQPNIEQRIKWLPQEARANFKTLMDVSVENLKPNRKYIFIWPETALSFHPEYDFSAASSIMDMLNNKHDLITGKMKFVEKPFKKGDFYFYNSIFHILHNGLVIPVYDKHHLVPFGEYLPMRFLLEKIGFSQINFFKSEFSQGQKFSPYSITKTLHSGGLICYEAIFPQYAKIFKNNGANILINLTNDAWFGNSSGPYQHLVQTRFRAIENNIPIIRSANTGISAYIDNNGYIINSIPLNKKGFVDIELNNLKFN